MSLRIDRQLWRKSRMHGMRLLCPASLVCGSCMAQAFGDLPRCHVQKRIVCFVLALIHDLACCSHLLFALPPGWSFHSDPYSITIQKGYLFLILMDTDACAQSDWWNRGPWRRFRSRWRGRESRENWKCVWRKRSRDSIITIPTAMARTGDESTPTHAQSCDSNRPDSSTVARRRGRGHSRA